MTLSSILESIQSTEKFEARLLPLRDIERDLAQYVRHSQGHDKEESSPSWQDSKLETFLFLSGLRQRDSVSFLVLLSLSFLFIRLSSLSAPRVPTRKLRWPFRKTWKLWGADKMRRPGVPRTMNGISRAGRFSRLLVRRKTRCRAASAGSAPSLTHSKVFFCLRYVFTSTAKSMGRRGETILSRRHFVVSAFTKAT